LVDLLESFNDARNYKCQKLKNTTRFTQTFNFCYEKGNSAKTGFEFILSDQTDICPIPAAWSWKK
jgi:hypothetical protein